MRLLNRTAGRLSRHRRGPLAGLAVLLLGLLISGSLYTVFSPAQADSQASETEQVAKGKELFLASCSFCHGQNGEGVPTVRDGYQLGPSLVGVGAAAVDFQVGTGRMPMAQPRPAGAAQARRVSTTTRSPRSPPTSPRWAPARPSPTRPTTRSTSLSEEERQEAISRGGQIFLTNCTACHNFNGAGGAMPRGGYAPTLHGVEPKYIFEAMLTGPQQMPNFSNGNLSPEEKRDVIAYLGSLEETPEYAGFTLGGLGPVSEGLFAWVIGIGGLVGAAVWIASHTTRSKKNKVNA